MSRRLNIRISKGNPCIFFSIFFFLEISEYGPCIRENTKGKVSKNGIVFFNTSLLDPPFSSHFKGTLALKGAGGLTFFGSDGSLDKGLYTRLLDPFLIKRHEYFFTNIKNLIGLVG